MGLYTVNETTKKMEKIEPVTFGNINVQERSGLQEWIANTPECLGEKLLIIAKEFDGFDGTRERSDLLALDNKGRLVVIENKLDGSGRDVVWQALKYAAYYSTFTTADIIRTSAKLVGNGEEGKAKENITSFLKEEVDRDGELRLNPDGKPRVLLVARKFPREVTATVLWLINRFNMDIRCHIATPYKHGDEILLRTKQLLPLPEEDEFMIKFAQKEAEEKASSDADERRFDRRRRFWRQTLAEFRTRGISLFQNNNESASGEIYTSAEFSELGGYEMAFKYKAARISLYINVDGNEKIKTRKAFDSLARHKDEIQRDFGDEYKLHWLRDEGLRQKDTNASQIMCEKEFPGYEEETWKERINWLADNMPKFESAVKDRLKQARDDALAD